MKLNRLKDWTVQSAWQANVSALPLSKALLPDYFLQPFSKARTSTTRWRLTSSHMYHPSCQNEPGSGRPPRRWRLLHRWGRGSSGRRPPASFLSQNCPSRRSKQKAVMLEMTERAREGGEADGVVSYREPILTLSRNSPIIKKHLVWYIED